MSTVQIIAVSIGWTAALTATAALIAVRRQAGRIRRERARTFPWKGGEVSISAPLSEAEYEEIKARWQALHGQPGRAHHVTELRPEEQQ